MLNQSHALYETHCAPLAGMPHPGTHQLTSPVTTAVTLTIVPMQPEHFAGVVPISSPRDPDPQCYGAADLEQAVRRFPEGQFVGLLNGQVVSYAITMLTHVPPWEKHLPWVAMIGDLALRNHDPEGEWLYGVDFAVERTLRRQGIGTRMYDARFELVRRLNLRGFYAGGMLMGYHRFRQQMTVREYGERVINGQLEDPTVTMQMRRGFRAHQVIENYVPMDSAGNGAVLIEWRNPAYRRQIAPAQPRPELHLADLAAPVRQSA